VKRLLGAGVVVGIVASAAYVAGAYTPSYIAAPPAATTTLAWTAGSTVNYKHWTGNSTATNVTGVAAAVAEIDAAIASIAAGTSLTFVNTGTFSGAGSAVADGVNQVTLANTAANAAAVGGALAVDVFYFTTPGGQITEADMIFNSSVLFTTNGTSGQYDLRSVAAHEAGHSVGLDHCALCNSTMFPFSYTGQTVQRSPSTDDYAGLRQLYPTGPILAPFGYGVLNGQVNLSTGGGAQGAHVFLTDAVRGIVGPSALTNSTGAYSISGVPAGVYRVNVEPLDSPMTTSNLGLGGWAGATFSTAFRSTTLGGLNPLVAAKAGVTTSVPAITVTNTAPTLNPVAAFPMSTATGGFSFQTGKPVVLMPPYTQWIGIVGSGFHNLPDSAFSFDTPFITITGPSTQSGSSGGGYKIFPINVAAETPPGGYSIKVSNAGETAFGAGLVEVDTPASLPAFVASYGASCPSTGAVTLSNQGLPAIGNASFQLRCLGTTPGRTVYFLLGVTSDGFFTGGNFSGATACTVYLDLNNLIFPFPGLVVTAVTATTIQPIPIPAKPSRRRSCRR
jgi:hypothetical protein